MARLLWLADVLRAAGLTVHEVDGWRTRGSDSFGPVLGVICHETRGSATSTDAGEIGVLVNGREGLSGPIAQLYLSRTGHWHVVASGTCHHVKTGWGGPFSGYGNDSLLGIEAQHAESEDWANKPVQYQSYVRGVAAILRHTGWPPPVGHKEHQPNDKPDPEFNMTNFRAQVAAAVAKGDDDVTQAIIGKHPTSGQLYFCSGGFSHPITAANITDIKYLASQGAYTLATGRDGAEWEGGGLIRKGWSEAVFGPVWSPSAAPELTGEQLEILSVKISAKLSALRFVAS